MDISRKSLLLLIVLSVALLALTACGGGEQPPAQQPATPPAAKTEPPPAPPSAPPATEDAKVARGKEVATTMGCLACHTVDGSASVGPTWQGVFGHEVTVILPDGSETKVTAEEAYLKESILNAGAKIVKGYAPSMPSYEGQISEEDLEALIAYIKTLKGEHK
ncbi:cytochrome c [Candidatus Acetothermia bacterium]|nr:cytochrome c [Candidatus Acetothermia bacterium]MCI2431472.1 cytochrome c [Candidatus Acetothermia bacterium]MCI2436434.1 cytochrome c [Candidatus Acetothermia bacterium]